MQQFKIGNWISYDIQDEPIGTIVSFMKDDFVEINIGQNTLCVPIKCIKLWTPEPGEWCWFYNLTTDVPTLAKLIEITSLFGREQTYIIKTPSCISEISYNYSRTMSFKHCQPFIGELPSYLKDK